MSDRHASLLSRIRAKRAEQRLVDQLTQVTAEDRHYMTSAYNDTVPLPAGAADYLLENNPALEALRQRYASLDLPSSVHHQWGAGLTGFINRYLQYFRGDTPYVWNYRELRRVTRLKYFVFLQYIRGIDTHHLLAHLEEDGAFGCWTHDFEGSPTVSRDLLDSINEISFLQRQLDILSCGDLRVLDIGAGYGRLAHRLCVAAPAISDYCCVDAIPESSFLCDYYLHHRRLERQARVVTLDRVESDLQPGQFDLAVNIHSFSECTLTAVRWWILQLQRLRIPKVLIVPNAPTQLLTNEADGSARDYRPYLEEAGYRLRLSEPVFDDAGVRDVLGIEDHFFLFENEDAA